MPSIFSRSKQPTVQNISGPILCEPPRLEDFRDVRSYASGANAPRAQANQPRSSEPSMSSIINMYGQAGTNVRASSPVSEYSVSQYDDESVAISSPASSPSFDTRKAVASPGRYPNQATCIPIQQAPKHIQFQAPTTRNDALGRGLSQRFGPSSYGRIPTRIPATTRPSTVRTRTDTRWQGHWLKFGTMRIDKKELARREKEAEKTRKKIEKERKKMEKMEKAGK